LIHGKCSYIVKGICFWANRASEKTFLRLCASATKAQSFTKFFSREVQKLFSALLFRTQGTKVFNSLFLFGFPVTFWVKLCVFVSLRQKKTGKFLKLRCGENSDLLKGQRKKP